MKLLFIYEIRLRKFVFFKIFYDELIKIKYVIWYEDKNG